MIRVVLASASPARRVVLEQAGLHPEVIVSDVDESLAGVADPAALAAVLAERKAEAVFARLGGNRGQGRDRGVGFPSQGVSAGGAAAGTLVVIGCDSVLAFEGHTLGKPGSPEAAIALWRRIRGKTAQLVTGHHVIVADADGVRRSNRSAKTVVHFADLLDDEIAAYVATGEPERVAGGFTIDGLGGPFVTGLEGDPHNVVGLSLPLLRHMLADFGVRWTALWPAGLLRSDRQPPLRLADDE
ncbi:MAG: Maf family nucleotide pyrophosphatase [Propionibacteriaceae bacterium]|jgi:septum formation protein|nr:Maf family nucleotide pyrophosphatase [Propionibacteriaceae bacterium]